MYSRLTAWLNWLIQQIHRLWSRTPWRHDLSLLALAALIGLASGLGAIAFRALLDAAAILFGWWNQLLVQINPSDDYHFLLPLMPALGGLAVGLIIHYWAEETRGGGVPAVIRALAVENGVIRARVVAAKALASAVCLGSGGSAGSEGPTIQIGSAIGSNVGQFFNLSPQRLRTLIGCGAGASIAAIFDTPLAGVLFALEVILGELTIKAVTPVILSSVLAVAVTEMFIPGEQVLNVPAHEIVHLWELGPYLILGIAAGLFAVGFLRLLYYTEDRFDSMSIPPFTKPAIGGLLVGIIGIYESDVFGVGYGTINAVLNDVLQPSMLIMLFLAKIIATLFTLGSGGSGGIFAPSLFLGALLGSILAHIFGAAAPTQFALVGMAAIVGGTTHAPFTAGIMIFELTGSYVLILPLMLTTIVSTMIAQMIEPDSIYTKRLTRAGIRLRHGIDMSVLEKVTVSEVMDSHVEHITSDTPLGNIVHLIQDGRYTDFPVVDEEGVLEGVLPFEHIRSVLLESQVYRLVIAKDVLVADIEAVTQNETLAEALVKFGLQNVNQLPVVDNENRVIGTLGRTAIIHRYQEELFLHREHEA